MKYKVGDRVRVKSLEWYNRNKDADGYIHPDAEISFAPGMSKLCGQEFTVAQIAFGGYLFAEDTAHFVFPEYAIEDPVEERINKLAVMYADGLNEEKRSKEYQEEKQPIPMSDFDVIDLDHNIADKVEIRLGDYELHQENGTWFAIKKKKEYPKTYEECINILGGTSIIDIITYYYGKQLKTLYKLLICRDAYWKIAGKEMGLGKPWEPTKGDSVFSISRTRGKISTFRHIGGCCIFEFPTKEMRDAFKENFDPDIEICKELL